jgi:hypothetical protein
MLRISTSSILSLCAGLITVKYLYLAEMLSLTLAVTKSIVCQVSEKGDKHPRRPRLYESS